MIDRERFSANLRAAHNKSGLTQHKAAEMSGIDYVMVNRYLCGVRMPGAERLYRIARVYGTTMDDLMKGVVK